MTTIDPSRRAVIAGGTAAAVLGMIAAPVHAGEKSGLTNLIAHHKTVRQALCVAIDAQEEIEARYKAVYPKTIFTPSAHCFYELHSGYDFCKDGIVEDFEEQRKMLKSLARLDPAAGEVALAAIDAKEAERIATLDENFAALDAREEEFGLGAANRLYEETRDAEREAILALLAYRCRNIEEARIKTEYVYSPALRAEIHEDEYLETFLRSFIDTPAGFDTAPFDALRDVPATSNT
jgi:hypothetical protein